MTQIDDTTRLTHPMTHTPSCVTPVSPHDTTSDLRKRRTAAQRLSRVCHPMTQGAVSVSFTPPLEGGDMTQIQRVHRFSDTDQEQT